MSGNCEEKCPRARSRSPQVIEETVAECFSSQNPGTSASFSDQDACSENANTAKPTCPICLEPCIQPIKLPCSHIFCFLCVKGVLHYNLKCPLCRKAIPARCLKNPCLLEVDESEDSEHEFKWFYEGMAGWWQYDDRTNNEIEDAFQEGEKQLELMIAGSVYIVDLEKGFQARKDFPNRKRHIKRDLASISKKGVAGIKLKNAFKKKASKNKRKCTGKKQKANSSPQQNRVNSTQQSITNSAVQQGTASFAQQNKANSPQHNATSSALQQNTANSPHQNTADSPQQNTADSPLQNTADSPQPNTADSPQKNTADSPQQNTADSLQQKGSSSTLQQNGSNSVANIFLPLVHVINIFSGGNNWNITSTDQNIQVTYH